MPQYLSMGHRHASWIHEYACTERAYSQLVAHRYRLCRDRQHLISAASLLRQPATAEGSPAAEPLQEHRAATRKNARLCQPTSRYDESFARHPAVMPGFRRTVLFRASVPASLTAITSPLRREFSWSSSRTLGFPGHP
jgi:hypothetical protein